MVKSKNVLITGTSGLIGGYILKLLEDAQYINVIPIDRSIIPDLSNSASVNTLHKFNKIDFIVHTAALIPGNNTTDESAAHTNFKIDNNIFEYAKTIGTKILYMSSMSVYKNYGEDILITETMPVVKDATLKYVTEKLYAEEMFRQINGSTIFRISSPFGIGQKNRNVLKIFFDYVKANKDIVIFGDGSRTQDFINGSDIAKAVLSVLEREISGIFNIVSGKSISMLNLAGLFIKLYPNYTGKIHVNTIPDNQGYFRANFSNAKARNILNWSPTISLQHGLSELL
ncbi:MAG: NAD(P)-dependent oxidoreductase [Deltaproteobacteria bacterium]|jgi:UDP-glucose 4-epimerase|nr:NAD(P)-dependent oxidoreductase [Deltaproteobacteria bacterium]